MINFFNISNLSKKNLLNIINLNHSPSLLKNKSLGLIFEKYSTRTRLSFSVGISQLGGNTIDIKFEELNISRDESFEDTFRAMNLYLDGIVYRTKNHQNLINASKYFEKPIINALSDISHPCQILSDLLTLFEKFKSFDLHILWMGDMNNVCYSLVEAANLLSEMKLTICSPISISEKKNWNLNENIEIVNDLKNVNLSQISCVMTDVFISMNDEESSEKNSLLKSYNVNSDLMSKTSKNSVFMHCLPAKVGFEVDDEVFRGPKSIVWKQAYNRMVAQKKLLQFIYQ